MGRPINVLMGSTSLPLSASVSPTIADGGSGTTTINSNSVTCTAAEGSPPYSYLWEWVSNPDNITIVSTTSASTTFRMTGAVAGSTYTGMARCKVTDGAGTVAYSDNVSVTLERL